VSETWIDAGLADKLLPEDVAPFEHGGKSNALYCTADDRFYATDGHNTQEDVELADGFISGNNCRVSNAKCSV
jgi:3-phenylpropionate/trans-cinnamate dioxygenase ferredoxin subunit